MERHSILNDCQHGFRAQRSCETQILTLYHELAASLDKKIQTDMIILDFSKAFDRVSHQRLLNNVHHCGIRGTTYQWITLFLNSRTQQVLVEGQSSEKVPVVSGVSEGSVLGAVLFLILINDIPTTLTPELDSSPMTLYSIDKYHLKPINTFYKKTWSGLPHGRRPVEWNSTNRSVVSCASPEHESPEPSSAILKVYP